MADEEAPRRGVRTNERLGWDLATEPIVVKIRGFGVVMCYVLVQSRTGLHEPWAVRAFLPLEVMRSTRSSAVALCGRTVPVTFTSAPRVTLAEVEGSSCA